MEMPPLGKYIRGMTSNVNQYIEKRMAPHGLGHGQFEYFVLIASNEGINQNDIAKIKNVGKASVTKAIKILEKEGLIERTIDEKDKRNFKLYCTNKGKAIVQSFSSYQSEVEETVFDGLSSDEVQQLYRFLGQMYKNSFKLINKV